jgi:hypothetical protein
MHGIGLLAGPVTLELFHELPANDHPWACFFSKKAPVLPLYVRTCPDWRLRDAFSTALATKYFIFKIKQFLQPK